MLVTASITNNRKIMTLVVAVVMMLSLGVRAMAEDDHTVTIKQNNSEGIAGAETYNLYKIFDVTKTEEQSEYKTTAGGAGTEEGFSYTISTSNPWFAKLGSVSEGTWTKATGQDWVTLTPSAADSTVYNVTWVGANTADAAKGFAEYLKANKGTIAADKTATSNGTQAQVNVSDGYWLIDSSLGTSLILATTDVEIDTKNSYPSTSKDVAKTNYNVGDLVDYTITVNLPASTDWTKPVIVHDTMDDVLALKTSSVHAKVTDENDFDSHVTLVQSSAFAATHDDTAHPATTGKTLFDFTLDISSLAPASGEDPVAKTVIITYQAELLSTAAADTDLVNKEFVEYSKYKTPEDDAKIKTYDFDLEKTFTGSTDTSLEATFNLYASTTSASTKTYYLDENKTEQSPNNAETEYFEETPGTTSKNASPIQFVEETKYSSYVKADSDDATKTATITAKLGTTLKVRGLSEGTYYLTEVSTAEGYNLMTEDIVVVIDSEGNATVSGTSDLFSASGSKITVVNNTGKVLPSTGGIGTTIFYIVGTILVLGAGLTLVSRKRMSAK